MPIFPWPGARLPADSRARGDPPGIALTASSSGPAHGDKPYSRSRFRRNSQPNGEIQCARPYEIPPCPEESPHQAIRNAAHFLVRQCALIPISHHLRRWPIDQHCPRHLHRPGVCRAHKRYCADGRQPQSAERRPGVCLDPRHEFNFWFDPEATHHRLACRLAASTDHGRCLHQGRLPSADA